MKTRSRTQLPSAAEIAWSHAGIFRRVIAWPTLAFQRRHGDTWVDETAPEGALAAAAHEIRELTWRRFLEFLPGAERAFVAQFRLGRMEALQVIAHCPELLPILQETPALTVFVSAHVALRGSERPGWDEISAVFDRSGIYGLLEWLGLPATPKTLTALRNFADPEIPRKFLAPLRTILWDGPTITTLERSNVVTDLDLARHCHALAA